MVLPNFPPTVVTNSRATSTSRAGRIALIVLSTVLIAIFVIPDVLLRIPRYERTTDETAATAAKPSTTPPKTDDDDENDEYARTPMCDPSTGVCGEDPTVPSPRTVHSAKTAAQYDLWWEAHAALNRSAAEYAASLLVLDGDGGGGNDDNGEDDGGRVAGVGSTSASRRRRPRPLILLGDSITESWLGTDMGRPAERARGVPEVLERDLVHAENGGMREYEPLVLAMGGDQTQHLLYRMEHGEILPAYADRTDAVFVVLIGTNNLGSGILPGPTAEGIAAVAEYVLKSTRGMLVVLEILPRGDSHRSEKLCPPRCDSRGDPFSSYMPAVRKVNAALAGILPPMSERYAGRMLLGDCGSIFLPKDRGAVVGGSGVVPEVDLMPDRLHPNAEGHRVLAKCIRGYIDKLPTFQ